jgi:hypothetical protein
VEGPGFHPSTAKKKREREGKRETEREGKEEARDDRPPYQAK